MSAISKGISKISVTLYGRIGDTPLHFHNFRGERRIMILMQ